MANNREPVKPDTESGDSSEPESDSLPDQKHLTQTTPSSQFALQSDPFFSSDEEEEESESDSDPRQSSTGAKTPRSQPAPAGKRPEEENGTDGEKSKEVEKKSTPLRVWSEDDVIVTLKGMVDFSDKKNADPVAELDSFLHSIKKNLHFDVTRRQLQDKIRKLKGKFETNKKKGREMIFPNPHEQLAFELSKSIWGIEDNAEKGVVNGIADETVVSSKRKGDERAFPVAKRAVSVGIKLFQNAEGGVGEQVILNTNANETVVRRKPPGERAFPVEEMVLSVGDKLFENAEGGEEWNSLKLEKMDNYLQHLEIRKKQTKLVIDRLKLKLGGI